ncbi:MULTISPECIES: aminotransferase class I/II-fold pyridoxal phosphate-dependent enzyme [unclassified Clostridium]|uniref:aminotransferase class I/II-fold pyridoxal phosphate-dependent enzyme n=1 Tax=unclassified Clostridium TaxID=2614128 RepID=UPI0002985A9F|nr:MULTISPECIES: aminotransferase class I/II-fold pyridoxal phosphate-dependent enzyme [unclassified Clostridium]EKQ57638.1 MAG: cystathionine beta-lyase/cystathionine gamma-synthase [Clostridium sp. Maddingley MBC34-26]
MDKSNFKDLGFSTKAIHGGNRKNDVGSAATPIYQSSTFIFDCAEQGGRIFSGDEAGYRYTRFGNPTNEVLEEKLAILEVAESCISTASGIGAISTALWTALKSGDHVISSSTIYGDTSAFLNNGLKKYGVETDFVDMSDPVNVLKAMKPNTKVVYIETPANPTLKLNDITAIAKIAHTNKNCIVMVDNTFCTPYIQRPLELGADVVLHSGTKFLNGHGDVVAGFILGSGDFIKEAKLGVQKLTGAILSPFDSYLVIRGLKTLPLRMEKHCENAMTVAQFLEEHEAVEKVYYPGLKSFKQYDLAQKQMSLPGAIIAFELTSGIEGGRTLMNSLKLCKLAVSLGDAETLIQHPASMSHSVCSKEERLSAGISDGLVRLAVGLEDVIDIIDDLRQALDLIAK